ncbi:hypothetical protein V8F33_010487 [Rhypophila sp. PSN 637]
MADRRDKRLAHMLSHAGRKDLVGLERGEALYQHLKTLLNPRTPLKLNDCRAPWVRALKMRYQIDYSYAGLDIICFTFGLRHFNLELIEILNDDVPDKVLELIQQTVKSIFQSTTPKSQDGSAMMKIFPWGDIAHFVSQSDWDLSQKYLEEIGREWNNCRERYDTFRSDTASGLPDTAGDGANNEVTLPSFGEFVAELEQVNRRHASIGGRGNP